MQIFCYLTPAKLIAVVDPSLQFDVRHGSALTWVTDLRSQLRDKTPRCHTCFPRDGPFSTFPTDSDPRGKASWGTPVSPWVVVLAWTLLAAAVRREELFKILLYSSTSNVPFFSRKSFPPLLLAGAQALGRGADAIGMEVLEAGVVCVPVSPVCKPGKCTEA